jgi:hypothetical protein
MLFGSLSNPNVATLTFPPKACRIKFSRPWSAYGRHIHKPGPVASKIIFCSTYPSVVGRKKISESLYSYRIWPNFVSYNSSIFGTIVVKRKENNSFYCGGQTCCDCRVHLRLTDSGAVSNPYNSNGKKPSILQHNKIFLWTFSVSTMKQ